MSAIRLDYYLSKCAGLKDLFHSVEEEFLAKGLIHHNWHHVLRDLARAIMIGEAEKANMKVVLASVLLHDIGRLHPEEREDHYTIGAARAPGYLKKAGFTGGEISEIAHCIKAHGPRGVEEPKTLEAKVVYDVDVHSCSIGYVGVARVFDFFMREERMCVKDMMEIPSGRKGPRKDFYTKTGETLGKKGLRRARGFWEELERELREEERTVKEIIPDYEGD